MNELYQKGREALMQLLEERRYPELIRRLDTLQPIDAADFLSTLDRTHLPIVFRLLKKDTAAEIFTELDPERCEELVEGMADGEIVRVFDELFVDDAVDMLEEMPAGMVARIMQLAKPEVRDEINRFLAYPPDSAGSIMTSELIDLRGEMTCAEAIGRIRRIGLDKETVYVAYVTDNKRHLRGVVPLRSLLFAEPEQKISEIMDENVIHATTHDDREQVANLISHYDMLALPIVDLEGRLVGLVTVDDALDVLETEATEDIEKMAAILPTDKTYMRTGVFETWKKRVPWLIVLMITATLTGAIITRYEHAIGTYAILTAFFPMLMNTGGNAGGQTSAMIIRGLSLGDIAMGDIFRVLWKELRVALLCGLTLSAVTFLKVIALDFRFVFFETLPGGEVQNNLVIAAIIAATVFFAILVAKLVGVLLPIGAKRIGLDPAVVANPFITTIVDTVTLMIYFAIASHVLHF